MTLTPEYMPVRDCSPASEEYQYFVEAWKGQSEAHQSRAGGVLCGETGDFESFCTLAELLAWHAIIGSRVRSGEIDGLNASRWVCTETYLERDFRVERSRLEN